MTYEVTGSKQPKKTSLRVISEMPTSRILSYVAFRHRVGLLGFSSFVLGSYIAYDKLIRLFV